MRLGIKNMVCDHCIAAVRKALTDLGHDVISVELGRAEIGGELADEDMRQLSERLESLGFELIVSQEKGIVERIKHVMLEAVRRNEPLEERLSDYLARMIGKDFRSLSRLFAESEGRTIERYHILLKTEYVKELLLDGELNISEIAYRLGYSSAAHLSRQFKEVTGMTPTEFRRSGHRTALNNV